jgi:CP family cyanate transporter-like MFS transporter
VLLPSLIKSAFPARVGVLTGVYTSCIAIAAGLSSGVSVPLAARAPRGWRGALAVWLIPAAVAIVVWLPRWGYRTAPAGARESVPLGALLRSPVAWNVAIYMGVQSLLFYSFVAWLPAMLHFKGIAPETAGYFASVFQWIGIPASFAVSLLAGRLKGQRLLASVIALVYASGLLLLLLAGSQPALLLGVLLCGLCTGACLSLSMCLMNLRTSSPAQTAALSGVSQSFGYALAAVRPALLGGIYDRAGSWTIPLLFLLAMTAVLFVSGLFAGRRGVIPFAARPESADPAER